MYVAENESVANISSNVQIIDNNYVKQVQKMNKQFQSDKLLSLNKGISVESVENEGQGKISIDELFQHYIGNEI